jgi:hypothetical protein
LLLWGYLLLPPTGLIGFDAPSTDGDATLGTTFGEVGWLWYRAITLLISVDNRSSGALLLLWKTHLSTSRATVPVDNVDVEARG